METTLHAADTKLTNRMLSPEAEEGQEHLEHTDHMITETLSPTDFPSDEVDAEEEDIYDDDEDAVVEEYVGDQDYSDMGLSLSDYLEEEVIDHALTKDEQVKVIHDRAEMDAINKTYTNAKKDTQETREQIKKSIGKVEELQKERDKIYKDIVEAEETSNSASLYRLRAHHERLCLEMEGEQNICDDLRLKLLQQEYDLNKREVHRATFMYAHHDLPQKEEMFHLQKKIAAKNRIEKEEKYALSAITAMEKAESGYANAMVAKQKAIRHAVEEANRSRARVQKFINMSLAKIKNQEKEENVKHRKNLKKRMDMLLQLKFNIATNRENIRSLTSRDKAIKQLLADEDERRRNEMWEAGHNTDAFMFIQQRNREWEIKKQKFEDEQVTKKAEIFEKILKEEEAIRKKKEMNHRLLIDKEADKDRIVKPLPKAMPKTLDIIERQIEPPRPPVYRPVGPEEDSEYMNIVKGSKSTSSTWEVDIDTEQLAVTKDTMDKPEFAGLWSDHKPYTVLTGKDVIKTTPGATKMEKDILEKRFDMQREGIVTKQIVVGREFKGQAFYSKPDVIHFKDFDVGKTYKKKVILTNVSYSVNYCKLLGITEHLKDFIHILFEPPGNMSAGMTCDMVVTFKPMINSDLKGEVFFMAQTGDFSVPLICSTKKCDLSLDLEKVDFGNLVIGETVKKIVTLTNKGAKGTDFEFCKVTNLKRKSLTASATSLGRFTTEESVAPRTASPGLRDKSAKSNKSLRGSLARRTGSGSARSKTVEDVAKLSDVEDDINKQLQGHDNLTIVDEVDEIPTPEPEDDIIEKLDLSDLDNLDGMQTGTVNTGSIEPFSSVKLEIVWQPTIPGTTDTQFIVTFDDEESSNLEVAVHARAIDVPVWVQRETVDLKICMYDRLYQDTLIVNNRATSALKLKFEVCKELRDHLEILPKTGYIQSQAQFSAQLKFLPRKSLKTESCKYFDKDTGVLEVPLLIKVADQTRPVPYTLTAIITTSDLKFSVKDVDFGHATMYESVKTTVQLTNKSILPQQFGFIGLPKYVDVQPNDGFGTLLPLETIDLDIMFKPKKAQNYSFTLTCKSLINRDFVINCSGIGVHPPLQLSHQTVNFAATALYDVSTTCIRVCNSHTSTNEFTHPVPRIGTGEVAPVGPTSFEFVVPDGCPLQISPCVGTVLPGRERSVEIMFKPELDIDHIKHEGVRLVTKQLKAQADKEYQAQVLAAKEQDDNAKKATKKKAKPKKASSSVVSSVVLGSGPKEVVVPDLDSIVDNSPGYWTAVSSLLRHRENKFYTYTIPCYISSDDCSKPGPHKYSIHNTLYVDVHCPVVKPSLMVISNNGNTATNFNDISIGQTVTKSVTIQNITHVPLKLTASTLHPSGPFVMLNALRPLPPDGSHTMHFSFTPTAGEIFHEVLRIHTGSTTLYMTLVGQGVEPTINLSVDNVLDMGAVLVNEYVEKAITLQNISSLSVNFTIEMDSLSPFRHEKSQETHAFLKLNDKSRFLVGTQNNNGQSVFDCVPCRGTIVPGATAEITVTFAPDHTSEHYSDFARIQLFGQAETYSFQLLGSAKPSIMYITGADSRTPDVESLALMDVEMEKIDEGEPKIDPIPLLLTVYSKMHSSGYEPGMRQFFVGCVRTMAVSQKKSGEFSFENMQLLNNKGFTIEPQKGLVEAGALKPVTITWTPTPDHDPNETVESSIIVTLRGDIAEQYKLMIRALVVS